MYSALAVGFVATFVATFAIAKLAVAKGYIDTPKGHKSHVATAAPIGGLAIFVVVLFGTLATQPSGEDLYFLAAIALLVGAGAVDEYFELGVLPRVIVEFFASFIMAFGAGIVLTHFGNLFGFGVVYLAFPVGLLFTAIAVFGTINAWNMIDGIDGLAATMALLSIGSFLVVTVGHESLPVAVYLIFGGLFAFLLFNFSNGSGLLPKVFLGDAGSKLIGFCLVWFMIRDTQGEGLDFKPATALFVMGLPIMDMTTTVLNRLQRRESPFSPDQSHLHHVLIARGLSRIQTYWFVVAIALSLHILGICLHWFQTEGFIQFGLYALFFVIYHLLVSSAKKGINFVTEATVGAKNANYS